MNPTGKYVQFQGIQLKDRQWPRRMIAKAPIWCSVDLRDGNQALEVPMAVEQKLEMFLMLVKCGFKEIEVGFPSASPTEFEFTRRLIEGNLIPDDVTIQVLTQAREDLIKRTVESLSGAKKAIIHLYNSTSPAQRQIVFGFSKQQVVKMAVQGTKWVKEYSGQLQGTDVRFEYSPESFSATEVDFSLEVCEAVMGAWGPTLERKIILNLPDTVQMATPNVHADQIEWFCRNMSRRIWAIISLHTHNDRGTGVAATELGLLAGAERVEGTLFGNGERTGNLDIVTVALNLFGQGIDPELDFSDLDSLRQVYEKCTGMEVPPRQPYSGELVFTAFSGSHQDAIRKGLQSREQGKGAPWNVPYLVIDPEDVGREYKEVIRVNGQSGKGGIAYLLEKGYGLHLPKDMLREFGPIAKKQIDALGREATVVDLKTMFWTEYVERTAPYKIIYFNASSLGGKCQCSAIFSQEENNFQADGNGPIDAFINGLRKKGIQVRVFDFSEHALGEGEEADAIAYIKLQFSDGSMCWGAGVDTDSEQASIKAIISALNRGSKA